MSKKISKSSNNDNSGKITLSCPEHGDYHVDCYFSSVGPECPECYDKRNKQWDTALMVNKFITIHKSSYDYSKVKYKDNRNKVVIVCPKHGEFKLEPEKHLEGEGCPSCKVLENCSEKAKQFNEDRCKFANKKYGK